MDGGSSKSRLEVNCKKWAGKMIGEVLFVVSLNGSYMELYGVLISRLEIETILK